MLLYASYSGGMKKLIFVDKFEKVELKIYIERKYTSLGFLTRAHCI